MTEFKIFIIYIYEVSLTLNYNFQEMKMSIQMRSLLWFSKIHNKSNQFYILLKK